MEVADSRKRKSIGEEEQPPSKKKKTEEGGIYNYMFFVFISCFFCLFVFSFFLSSQFLWMNGGLNGVLSATHRDTVCGESVV